MAAQRMALRAHFRRSIWTLCLLNAALISAVFGFPGPLNMNHDDKWIFTELFLGGVVALLADFEALLWVGLWHGLSKRQAYKAVILTAAQLMGPSWLIIFFLIYLQRNFRSELGVAMIFALWFMVGWVADGFGVAWARSRLLPGFRRVSAQAYDKVE
jgi:hypothetical protein